MEISLSKAIFWVIDALMKRSMLIAFVALAVYSLSKKPPKICERYSDTEWNTKNVYQLFFLFLVVGYALPFLLGGIFYGNFAAFFVTTPVWKGNLVSLLSGVFTLGTIWYVVTHKYKQSISVLGFQKDRLGAGLVWGFGFLLLFELLLVYLKYARNMPISDEIKQFSPLGLLSTLTIGPVAEESLFRGYVYPNFRKRIGVGWGMLLSSICFVIFHPSWKDWPSLFMVGILFCFVYEKSGSLVAPIMGHIFKNILGVAVSNRSILFIYYIPWLAIWAVMAITVLVYLLILRYIPLPATKTSYTPFPTEIRKLAIEDSEEIIKNAARKGWIVAVILGAVIMYFLYFFQR